MISLRVFPSILAGNEVDRPLARLNRIAGVKWAATYAWFGGAKQLKIELASVDEAFLRMVEETWLGSHVALAQTGDGWNGFIYQIDRASGHSVVRRSLIGKDAPVYNAVRVDGGVWSTDDESIARYGRIEYDERDANADAADLVARWSRPRKTVVKLGDRPVEPKVTIYVCGYQSTAAFLLDETTTSATKTLDELFALLVTNSCPFLTLGHVDATTVSLTDVEFNAITQKTAWDKIKYLLTLLPEAEWRVYVDAKRKIHWVNVDTDVGYRLTRKGVYRLRARVLPHTIRPGVFADETAQPATRALVREVTQRSGRNFPQLRSVSTLDADLRG